MIASRAQERRVDAERKGRAAADLAAFRADKQERRRYGLRARHAAKLARLRAAQ